ncbi:MAG: DUF3667 domain-containing protein [Pseudomonadota bacterium]
MKRASGEAGGAEGVSVDPTVCLNCGARLSGDFCAECGQQASNPRRLVIGLVQDVIVDTISIDNKLVRTLGMLLAKPGRLARDYIDGRRVRYTAPFRLYLFSSLVFFLLLWTVVPFDEFEGAIQFEDGETERVGTTNTPTEGSETGIEGLVPTVVPNVEETGDAVDDAAERPPLQAVEPPEDNSSDEGAFDCGDIPETGPDTLAARLCVSGNAIEARLQGAADRVSQDPKLFFVQVRSNVPRAMLLAPIIYALINMALYFYRRRTWIYDHLVVSLYMHAALYAYLSIVILGVQIPLIGWFAPLLLVWGWIQSVMVFRQAYGSNWLSVALKFSVMNVSYFVCVVLLLLLGLGLALYQS